MSSPSVEKVQTQIPRQALLEYLYKQSKADGNNGSLIGMGLVGGGSCGYRGGALVGGSLVGGSLVGGGLVGGARPSTFDLYQAFVKQQMMKGRTKEMADHQWAELTRLPERVRLDIITDNAARTEDPTLVRTMGTMEPLAEEARQRASRDVMLHLWLKANKNPFPGYNYGRDDMLRGPPELGGSGVPIHDWKRYPYTSGALNDLQGGDIFGDILQGLSWLSPIGAAANVASMIAGGKAPKKKKPAAKKKAAPKKPAAKKGKSKKDLSGEGFLDDIGQAFSFLTPWGLAGQAAGALVGATS
jgi:hypothetical protein